MLIYTIVHIYITFTSPIHPHQLESNVFTKKERGFSRYFANDWRTKYGKSESFK